MLDAYRDPEGSDAYRDLEISDAFGGPSSGLLLFKKTPDGHLKCFDSVSLPWRSTSPCVSAPLSG